MIWVDITDAADVVFFAPIVRRLESGGHIVTVTARRFASADLVLRRYGVGAVLVGHHRGGGVAARAVGLANRTRQLLHSASDGRFDVAAGSHSSDFVLAGWTLGIPQMTFLEEEGLRASSSLAMRLADEVVVPDAVSVDALSVFRPAPRRFVRYPGFREEYYLHDMSPDPGALRRLAVDQRHVVGVVRPARPDGGTSSFASPGEAALVTLVRAVAGRRNVTLVLLARDREQRQRFLALGVSGLVAPEGPVDGVGLIAAADFVLGDGGIMTREAAALGTPAYTVARTPPTSIDRRLLDVGRLRFAAGPDDLRLKKKERRTTTFEPRNPQIFVDELLALARDRPRRLRAGRLAGADREVP